MDQKSLSAREVEDLLDQLVRQQERRVRDLAERIVPEVTYDELYAPDDVPRLKADPDFMFEDGYLAGVMAVQTALRASLRRSEKTKESTPDDALEG